MLGVPRTHEEWRESGYCKFFFFFFFLWPQWGLICRWDLYNWTVWMPEYVYWCVIWLMIWMNDSQSKTTAIWICKILCFLHVCGIESCGFVWVFFFLLKWNMSCILCEYFFHDFFLGFSGSDLHKSCTCTLKKVQVCVMACYDIIIIILIIIIMDFSPHMCLRVPLTWLNWKSTIHTVSYCGVIIVNTLIVNRELVFQSRFLLPSSFSFNINHCLIVYAACQSVVIFHSFILHPYKACKRPHSLSTRFWSLCSFMLFEAR